MPIRHIYHRLESYRVRHVLFRILSPQRRRWPNVTPSSLNLVLSRFGLECVK